MIESDEGGRVIPFPRQLRIVPSTPIEPPRSIRDEPQATLIDHDGRTYDLADLVRHLLHAERRDVGSAAPHTAQALWDEVVRRWPALAAEIVAGNQPAD